MNQKKPRTAILVTNKLELPERNDEKIKKKIMCW